MSIHLRHSRWALPAALLLSLAVAGQALAHTWSPQNGITSSGNGFADGLVTLNSTTAIAAYVEFNGSAYDVRVRRSTTSGDTWASPQIFSTDGYDSAISGLNPFVDLVWAENGQVMYVKSLDSGANYGLPLPLSPTGGSPTDLSVARGVNGVVVVAWQNGTTKAIKARVSTDEGVTFGNTATISSSRIQYMGTSVAVGYGVIYVAYKTTASKIKIKRSTNGGSSWSSPVGVTTTGYGVRDQFAITAEGTNAFIAYAVKHPNFAGSAAVRYRRTVNSGSSWSAEKNLAPATWKTSEPAITLQNGVVRACFTRDGGPGGIYYRQSSNGTTWSASESVSTVGHDPSVGYAGKIVVLEEFDQDVFARTGT